LSAETAFQRGVVSHFANQHQPTGLKPNPEPRQPNSARQVAGLTFPTGDNQF
jgi:hypothetical protein